MRGILGQFAPRGRHRLVFGTTAPAHHPPLFAPDLHGGRFNAAQIPAGSIRASEGAPLHHPSLQKRRQVQRLVAVYSPQGLACQERDTDGTHGTGIGRNQDFPAGDHGEGPRQRFAGGGFALEEDAIQELTITHDAVLVVANDRVLKAGKHIRKRIPIVQGLSRFVGHEHRTGLAQIGRVAPLPRQLAKTHDVVNPVQHCLLLQKGSRPGAAGAVHIGIHHHPATHVDKLGILPTDLHDGQTAAAIRIQADGGHCVRHDLVLDQQPGADIAEGGPKDGGGRIPARSGETNSHDRVGSLLEHLGHQRPGRLHRVAIGAAIHIGYDLACGQIEQSRFGSGGPQVQAQYGCGIVSRRGSRASVRFLSIAPPDVL